MLLTVHNMKSLHFRLAGLNTCCAIHCKCICISLWLRYFQNQAANLENLETNFQRGITIQRKVSAKKYRGSVWRRLLTGVFCW